ncbi:MAG: GTPase, partial [Candidatus Bathyarchaeota archaeon]
VDVYHEAIKKQIGHIESELSKIRKRKKIMRTTRAELGFPIISLAGYTVAGKSTLFNSLTGAGVKVAEGPFTTLSPKTSVVNFGGKKALLTDTVGFIDGLPITLIEAFKSTLEETTFSNLIILVIDCSEEFSEIERKLRCCLETLREIGIVTTPIITAFNKIDLIDHTRINELSKKLNVLASSPILISAIYDTNLSELKGLVSGRLRNFMRVSFELPLNSSCMSLISKIRKFASVLSQEYHNESVFVKVESADHLIDKIKNNVERLGGKLIEAERI